MTPWHDVALRELLEGVFALLIVASIAGFALSRTVKSERGRATVNNLNARVRAWWVMCVVFGIAVMTGGAGSLVLFTLPLAARAARVHDHRAHAARRCAHHLLEFLPVHAAPVLLHLDRLVRAVLDLPAGVRAHLHRGDRRRIGRHEALPRAHRRDHVGAHGVRVLPELRSGAAVPADPGLCRRREAAPLPRDRGTDQRCLPVRVRQDARQTSDRAPSEPEQDVGGLHWRRRDGYARRRGDLVGDALLAARRRRSWRSRSRCSDSPAGSS